MKTDQFLKQVLAVMFFFVSAKCFSQTTIKVTEGERHGWEKDEQHLGKIRFTNGPSKPPLQMGSLEFNAPVNGHARHVRMRNSNYDGVLLSSLTELSYSTFVQKAGSNRDVPLLVLLVDIDGDGSADGDGKEYTHLSFIPRFQNPMDTTGHPTKFGWYKPKKVSESGINWQYPVRQRVWQTWDALHGGWFAWTVKGNAVDTNPTMFSLAGFMAKHPNARIINDKNGGGIRLQAGGTPMADNFLGNADAFVIGINNKTTVYDFESGSMVVQGRMGKSTAKSKNY